MVLGPGRARCVSENVIEAVHETPAGTVTLRWVMEPDRLRVCAESPAEGINTLTLPGTFYPEGTNRFLAAVPNGQGILHTGKGPAFYRPLWGQGTEGFEMSMFAQLADRGALLAIAETDADAALHWEKTAEGTVRIMWRQVPCFGSLSYPREVVLIGTSPDLTGLCKAYRRYEIEHGRFVTWDEKIAARPKLADLFGSCIVYLGYWNDPQCDYAAGFRTIKAAGIDKAYVYPVYYYMNAPKDLAESAPVLAGPWADQRDLLPLLRELGYLCGSFIYISDAPQNSGIDTDEMRLDESGRLDVYWEMEGIQWFKLSSRKRLEIAADILERHHAGLDGVHFDTLCCGPLVEDYHPARRDDAQTDRAGRQAILELTGSRGMIVSSEGFWGRMTPYYDLGSTKYAYALGGDEYCIVPMTMLVYHDSAFHTWWEIDNYNNPEHLSQYGRGYQLRLPWGGGSPRRQSAMDALMGTPPDIFPFGMQWNLIPHSRQLYFYRYRWDDPRVQEAIALAKPVMALNSRIGKLEMTEHHLHRPDGALQETVFADGTRVIANFANVALEAPRAGRLPAESWTMLVD